MANVQSFERAEYQQVKADLHRKILDRLDLELPLERDQCHARPHAPRRPQERLPEAVRALLEQQDLASPAGRPPDRDAGAQHAAAVDDDEIVRIEQVDEVVEAPVLDRSGAMVHEQAGFVPARRRLLRDQLLGQRVVELVDTHRGSLAGDARPPANGTA